MTYSYGLSTGPYDVYTLPPLTFVRQSEEKGGGIFLFRIKPVSDGAVLTAVITSTGSPDQVTLQLYTAEGSLSLQLGTADKSSGKVSVPLSTADAGYQDITAALALNFFPNSVEAELVLKKDQSANIITAKIPVSGLMDGKCRVTLGKASDAEPVQTDGSVETRNKRDKTENSPPLWNLPVNVVWDQLAVFYQVPKEPMPAEPAVKEPALVPTESETREAILPSAETASKEAVSSPTEAVSKEAASKEAVSTDNPAPDVTENIAAVDGEDESAGLSVRSDTETVQETPESISEFPEANPEQTETALEQNITEDSQKDAETVINDDTTANIPDSR